MNSTPLSQEDFLKMKKNALENEPVTRTVKLNQISLVADSYKDGYVKLNDTSVSVSKAFFEDLSKMLNISNRLRADLTLGEKKKEGEDQAGMFATMVETLKLLKTSKDGDKYVIIIGDPAHGILTGIRNVNKYNRIPNEDLFTVSEQLMDKHPTLRATDITIAGGGIDMSINMLSEVNHQFVPVGTEDETFKFGISLGNGMNGTSIGDIAYRLICTNGMMGLKSGDPFNLPDLTPDGIRRLFEHIAEAEKRNFVPRLFEQNMRDAGRTQASYRELDQLYHAVIGNLVVEEDDALKDHIKREIARTYFRGYVATTAKLLAKKIDPVEMSKKEKSFVSTGQNMWEVINNLTWLGSHDSGYQWKNQRFLQKLGGKTMAEEFDLLHADLLKL